MSLCIKVDIIAKFLQIYSDFRLDPVAQLFPILAVFCRKSIGSRCLVSYVRICSFIHQNVGSERLIFFFSHSLRLFVSFYAYFLFSTSQTNS